MCQARKKKEKNPIRKFLLIAFLWDFPRSIHLKKWSDKKRSNWADKIWGSTEARGQRAVLPRKRCHVGKGWGSWYTSLTDETFHSLFPSILPILLDFYCTQPSSYQGWVLITHLYYGDAVFERSARLKSKKKKKKREMFWKFRAWSRRWVDTPGGSWRMHVKWTSHE